MKLFAVFAILGLFLTSVSCDNGPKEVVKSSHFNGKPKVVEYIGDDSTVFKTVEFYINGQKKIEGNFKNGKRHGEWSYWYENGKLWSRGSFIDGKSEGRFLSYDDKGLLFQESFYKNGIPEGKWAFYKNDKRIKAVYYENGKIINEVNL